MPVAHTALCVSTPSFCGWFTQSTTGLAGVGDGMGETGQVYRLELLVLR